MYWSPGSPPVCLTLSGHHPSGSFCFRLGARPSITSRLRETDRRRTGEVGRLGTELDDEDAVSGLSRDDDWEKARIANEREEEAWAIVRKRNDMLLISKMEDVKIVVITPTEICFRALILAHLHI